LAYERARLDPIAQRWHERLLAEPQANAERLARWWRTTRTAKGAASCIAISADWMFK
jgi:hypothetical protein